MSDISLSLSRVVALSPTTSILHRDISRKISAALLTITTATILQGAIIYLVNTMDMKYRVCVVTTLHCIVTTLHCIVTTIHYTV